MDTPEQNRIKSAMVLYQLERSLGTVAAKRLESIETNGTAAAIAERVGIVVSPGFEAARSLVEHSYLSEVLVLAEAAVKGTADERHMKELHGLFDRFSLFDIRNAISHPNRSFPDCYWFRCAAVATDPVVEKLGLIDVAAAFRSAQENSLEPPPDEWMAELSWGLPNNLPSTFEHELTGLVGRERDYEWLDRAIRSQRNALISVVAPGGVGKTALVLECLYDFCLSRNGTEVADCVVFVSLKQERLTARGVETILAPETIEGIRTEITNALSDLFSVSSTSFQTCKQALKEKKVLVFLDNLETVLRDAEDQFQRFYEELEDTKWRVIVTSRIPVDGAKNLPLSALNSPGALHLTRQYLHSRGSTTKDASLVERISRASGQNPLAIRLTCDVFLAGTDITEALIQTQRDVAAFSFTSLLQSLTTDSNAVLEALFVIGSPTRTELCEVLGLGLDEISACIAQLSRTSLIVRTSGETEERYELGLSIRDLLRAAPRSPTIRLRVEEALRRGRAIAADTLREQRDRNVSPLDPWFVPQGTPTSLVAAGREALQQLREGNAAGGEQRFRQTLGIYPNSAYAFRVHARLLEALRDNRSAEATLLQAIAKDGRDPAPQFMLFVLYWHEQRLEEAQRLAETLIDSGWGDPVAATPAYAVKLWGYYFTALLFTNQFDRVATETVSWRERGVLAAVFGIARASAFRRKAEGLVRGKLGASAEAIDSIVSAASVLDEVVKFGGYTKYAVQEIRKLLRETEYCNTHGFEVTGDAKASLQRFATRHESEVSQALGPQAAATLRRSTAPARRLDARFDGFTEVKISYIPRADGFPSYVFAKDEDGNDYYIHVRSFYESDWARWVFLEEGTQLFVRSELSEKGSARLRAIEAQLADPAALSP